MSPPSPDTPSSALLTDHYELTMVDAALSSGVADRPAVFEVFARQLPPGRRYGVVAGIERVADAIAAFRFGQAELDWLADRRIVSDHALAWLADYRFTGRIDAYREGEPFFPGSPVLTVVAPFAEAVVLETLVLSILNHDAAVAAAGARMVQAAAGRPVMEFGSRRTHEQAAVGAARAAYLVGFSGTSNLEAGRRYGIPTLGTIAHAFVMIHGDERAAFAAQLETLGPDSTLLVDTYDTIEGARRAIEASPDGLGSLRIDSGDLHAQGRAVRRMLDDADRTGTRLVASGNLDEHRLAALADAPFDAYGVGTWLVTGSGHPTAELVYKLVARGTDDGFEPVAKASAEKTTIGARKAATRMLADGTAVEERLTPWEAPPPADGRPLQVPVVVDGEVVHRPDLDEIRAHHRDAMAQLPAHAFDLADGGPAIPTRHVLPASARPPR